METTSSILQRTHCNVTLHCNTHCCEHLHHLLSNWWKCFLDLLVRLCFLKLQRIELSRPPLETHKEICLRQTRVRRWRGACGRSFLGPAVGSKAGSEHVHQRAAACSSHPGREAADSGSGAAATDQCCHQSRHTTEERRNAMKLRFRTIFKHLYTLLTIINVLAASDASSNGTGAGKASL